MATYNFTWIYSSSSTFCLIQPLQRFLRPTEKSRSPSSTFFSISLFLKSSSFSSDQSSKRSLLQRCFASRQVSPMSHESPCGKTKTYLMTYEKKQCFTYWFFCQHHEFAIQFPSQISPPTFLVQKHSLHAVPMHHLQHYP